MLNGQFFSRALLSQRLTDVEGVERQAHTNQEMILARRAQITSATNLSVKFSLLAYCQRFKRRQFTTVFRSHPTYQRQYSSAAFW